MATSVPPAEVQEFFNFSQTSDEQTLKKHPRYVDPSAFDHKAPGPLLRLDIAKTMELQKRYYDVQLAFFDFFGSCMYCGVTTRHGHGAQGTAVFEVVGFPGLRIYPEFGNYRVQVGLIDWLLLGRLPDLAEQTNVQGQVNVPSPPSSALGLETVSESFPITTDELLNKLQNLTLDDRLVDKSLPQTVRQLLQTIFSLEPESASAHISSSNQPLRLRRVNETGGVLLNVSLGCQGIFVVGEHSGSPHADQTDARAEKQEFANSSDSVPHTKPQRQSIGHDGGDALPRSEPNLLAIHLRTGDAVVLDGASSEAWYGTARVFEGTFPKWEQDWPAWDRNSADQRLQSWKGCMKGRKVDLVVSASNGK